VENWAGWIFKATSSRITDRLRLVIRERTRKTSLDAKTDDDVSLLDVLACMGANTASLDCRTLLD